MYKKELKDRIIKINPCKELQKLRKAPTEEQNRLEEQRKFATIIRGFSGKPPVKKITIQKPSKSELETFLEKEKYSGRPSQGQVIEHVNYTIANFSDSPDVYYEKGNRNLNYVSVVERCVYIAMEPLFSSGNTSEHLSFFIHDSFSQYARISLMKTVKNKEISWFNIFYNLTGAFNYCNFWHGADKYMLLKNKKGIYDILEEGSNTLPKPAMNFSEKGSLFNFKINDNEQERTVSFPRNINLVFLLDYCLDRIRQAAKKGTGAGNAPVI